jgi:hypothetical protein
VVLALHLQVVVVFESSDGRLRFLLRQSGEMTSALYNASGELMRRVPIRPMDWASMGTKIIYVGPGRRPLLVLQNCDDEGDPM